MLNSEDKFFFIKTCRNLKDFLLTDSSRSILTKIENTNIGQLFAKVAHNQFDQMQQEAVGHCHPELQIPLPQLKTQLR